MRKAIEFISRPWSILLLGGIYLLETGSATGLFYSFLSDPLLDYI